MFFSEDELTEFQDLCELHLGIRPTTQEAAADAAKLVYLVSLIQHDATQSNGLKFIVLRTKLTTVHTVPFRAKYFNFPH